MIMFVRAEIPDRDVEPELYEIVLRHMIHGPCGQLNPNSPCMKEGKCRKGYPKQFALSTLQGENSYPVYRRRDNGRMICLNGEFDQYIDNRWVVPYNPWLLKKYNCHINVEICSSICSVKYLYKYVYKGPDHVSIQVHHDNRHDEISQFVDARWVCSQEAFWKIFEFPMTRMYPSVFSLQIHLPNRHQVFYYAHQSIVNVLNDGRSQRTMLTEFFKMNMEDPDARQYLYREFPEHYRWLASEKRWSKRQNKIRVVGRVCAVSPQEGERYYLRILLNHIRGPLSFDHLLIVNGIRYSTFKQVAEVLGLLESDNSVRDSLFEACNTHMPAALRRLFVTILVYCEPVGVKNLWDEFKSYMSEDYTSSSSSSAFVDGLLLKELNCLLRQYGKSIDDYDFPRVNIEESHFSQMVDDEKSISISEEDISSVERLNLDQKNAFNTITRAVINGESKVFFVDGPGGTGKTFLYRSILAFLRKKGYIVLATASSGIASIMMPGGRTAHSRFKIPIRLESTSTCMISKQSDLAKLLRLSSAFIWDEATMAHRHAFEALDRTLRDIMDNNLPFGGKVAIFGGDFRQVLPVVQHSTKAETIDACIVKSILWNYITVIHLTENMRAKEDPMFANFLLRVGNGDEPYVENEMIKIPDEMVIPWKDGLSLKTFFNIIFPSLTANAYNTKYITEWALVTPRNECVDSLNEQIINIFPGDEVTYFSFDSVENDNHNLYPQEFLNSIAPGGLPPHKLTLKKGAPIMLLRNIDPRIGLCNGTRLICRNFYKNLIDAEIVNGQFSGTRVFIPRIPLKPSENVRLPFILIRKQFPIRLSFALTINKSQGQTIPYVGVYLPEHVFSHGQLYVALSRGVSMSSTKVLVKNGCIVNRHGTYTKNIVYKDVLMDCHSS